MSCVMNASLWRCLLWMIKLRNWGVVPLVTRADLLTVQSMLAYHLWHHLFSYTNGCAGAGRAFPSFGYGDLVMELLLTSFVRWFYTILSVVPRNLALTYCLWFEGFLLTNFWNTLNISPTLGFMASFTMFHCASFELLLLCSCVFNVKIPLYLPSVLVWSSCTGEPPLLLQLLQLFY